MFSSNRGRVSLLASVSSEGQDQPSQGQQRVEDDSAQHGSNDPCANKTTDNITDPNCNGKMDPDMALESSLGPDTTTTAPAAA